MRQRKEHIIKSIFFSPIGVALSLVLLVVLVRANYSLYEKNDTARENRETLLRELNAMELRKDRLSATLGRIGTDKGEEIALREQYDMGREGEEMIVVVDLDEAKSAQTEESTLWSYIRSLVPFF